MRSYKEITNKEDLALLYNLKESDITYSFLMESFAEFDEKPRFRPYDVFTIPKGIYGRDKKNTNEVKTTVGIYIWNKYFMEQDIGIYINETVDSDKWDDIMDDISRRVLEDDLDLSVIDHMLMKAQKLMPLCSVISPSVTDKFMKVSSVCEKKKKELAKKYKNEIEAGDAETASKMEKELLNYARDYLKDDPSLDIYDSGARSSFKNNFKNMYVMKGAVANPDPNSEKQFDIVLSCYNSGISKEDYPIICNSLASGLN